uniref:Multiple C2 and transmembrane domain containing 1 n=1 Tax=Myotis myotis TaxID=51298 RepID=A0A7J7Y1M5_MYOMY|nr:multiple C2 and transmembrane domain containing 1 [Myotis myotis]
MEPQAAAAGSSESAAAPSSFQARLWKNLQLGVAKSKGGGSSGRTGGQEQRTAATPSPSPPPPGGRREALAGAGGTGGRWIGFKKRKQVLDRVFSSSQPNLCCSSPEPLEPGGPARGEQGSTLRRRIREHLLPAGKGPAAATGAGGATPPGGRSPDSAPSSSSASSSLSSSPQPPPRGNRAQDEGAQRRGAAAHLCHQKSSSLPGTASLEQLLEPPPPPAGAERAQSSREPWTLEKGGECGGSQKINTSGTSNADVPLADPGMYQLDITLRKGQSLAARDRGGTSDPYVKFKVGGKEVFRSKIIHKNLNPVWEEKACILVDHLREPLYVKVFDYDFGLQDDFMGSAFLDLTQLELNRPTDVTLPLKDPHYPDHDLGIILLSVTLTPKEGEHRDVIMPKTLNPQWREQFDFHLYEERGGIIDITAWDKDAGKRDDFIGRCQVDLSVLSREQTHKLELQLEEGEGHLVLLVTLTASATVSISDLSVNSLEDQKEREEIFKRYSPLRIFHNLKDVGFLQVKVIRAEGLMAADVTGKSDPFCVVELNNDRLLTHTVYKNLNPEWNKVFTFNIKDIHSVLEVTVYDEDRDRSADFLGKVAIPLLSIQNGEQKAYVLKNKQLTGPTKGVIYLEIDVIFNAVKASLRTLIPKEQKYIEEENRLSKQLLLRNFIRTKRCVMVLINAAYYVNSCFDWDSPPRSLAAFVLFLFVVWNFELYMIPLVLLLLLTWNYFLIISGKDNRQRDTVVEDMLEDEEEEDDKDDKDSEKKGFINKIYAIQEVCISVQNILDEAASLGERIKNTFNWTVPFLSWLAIVALCVFTVVLYFIPLRYIVLVWGINKFTKKLRCPYAIDNNELLDFLSRVPSDVQVVQYQELKPDPSHSPCKRKKNNLG